MGVLGGFNRPSMCLRIYVSVFVHVVFPLLVVKESTTTGNISFVFFSRV